MVSQLLKNATFHALMTNETAGMLAVNSAMIEAKWMDRWMEAESSLIKGRSLQRLKFDFTPDISGKILKHYHSA